MADLHGRRSYCHFLAHSAPTVSGGSGSHRIFPPVSARRALVVEKMLGHKDAGRAKSQG